ncbi:hypothetical protein ACIRU8_42705 [Streptomyces sp. NPDC101175]|uniref:hypothetical protein n=1 Tax=Streptomyces sp. NPDC101175 TaxID=3366123 RepID=UPI003836D959
MPQHDQPQYERMTAGEISEYINTERSWTEPDAYGWEDALYAAKTAAKKRRRAERDDESWVKTRSEEDVLGVVEFLRDRAPETLWTADEFTAIATGSTTSTGTLADVVVAYSHWRDSAA